MLFPAGRFVEAAPAEATLSEDGRFLFPALPPGRYRLVAVGPHTPLCGMYVEIPTQDQVRFHCENWNAFVVRIHDSRGALARAGFLDGDLIVGAAGVIWENRSDLAACFLVPPEREVEFVVERAGRLLRVTADPKSLAGEDAGGMLEPVER